MNIYKILLPDFKQLVKNLDDPQLSHLLLFRVIILAELFKLYI